MRAALRFHAVDLVLILIDGELRRVPAAEIALLPLAGLC
jgi:hypothetical protein